MSAVFSPRRWAVSLLLVALAALIVTSLVGCGKKEEVDPYVYTSLRAVMQGDTLSPGFIFEIDAPEFDFVRGNVAIVRDGNVLEFLVADDLENLYPSLSGAMLGVVKSFTPAPTHLVLQRIKRGGIVQADSLSRPEYFLPKLIREGAIDLEIPGAAVPDVHWKKKDTLEPFLPDEESGDLKLVQTGITDFVWAPLHTLPDSVRANPSEEDMAWYAVFADATLLIEDVTPGADWMLHMLKAKDLPLIGALAVKELYEYRDRKIDHAEEGLGHIMGAMKLIWFRFGNTFVQGSLDE